MTTDTSAVSATWNLSSCSRAVSAYEFPSGASVTTPSGPTTGGGSSASHFLVGTCGVFDNTGTTGGESATNPSASDVSKNTLHLFSLGEEATELTLHGSWDSPCGGIYGIAQNKRNGATLIGGSSGWCVYGSDIGKGALNDFPAPIPTGMFAGVRGVAWDPHSPGKTMVFDKSCARIFDLKSKQEVVSLCADGSNSGTSTGKSSPTYKFTTAAYDPHHSNIIATAESSFVHLYDLRTKTSSPSISLQHSSEVNGSFGTFSVSSLDWNPNIPNQIASASEDGSYRIWETKKASNAVSAKNSTNTSTSNNIINPHQACLLHFSQSHSHWVSSIRYNPFHDQLVVTAGTDGVTNLWRLGDMGALAKSSGTSSGGGKNGEENSSGGVGGNAANSNAASGAGGSGAGVKPPRNLRVSNAEDAIYSVVWSGPWVYATVGWDGVFSVHRCPIEEKYRILL